MKRVILVFGLLSVATFILYRLSQFAYFRDQVSLGLIIAIFSLLFLGVGVYAAKTYGSKEGAATESSGAAPAIDANSIRQSGLSPRELEILSLIANGHSNNEIAEQLFVSESTVKKHVSNVLVKLDAKRRTQAIKIAKEMRIIA